MLCAVLTGCGGSGGGPSSNATPVPTPDTPADTTAPTITVTGSLSLTIEQGSNYTDSGARANDAVDGSITVDTSMTVADEVGVYTVTYTATDNSGNSATATRTVTVIAASYTTEGDTGSTTEGDTGSTADDDTGATALVVQVEDYTTYNDSDSGNTGNSYRNDDVDIEATSDAGGGFNVGWTAAGEWLEYEINLSAGLYAVTTRVASEASSGSYTLLLDGETIGSDSVSSTGGWQVFVTHTVGTVEVVSGGTLTLRLNVTGNDFNINWIEFTPDVDSDGDGVSDTSDQCLDTAGGAIVDILGCEVVEVNNEVSFANERLVGGPDSLTPGYTLYVFDNDLGAPGRSACNDGCATAWPPVLVEDAEASGVSGLSTIVRDDGSRQAAHNDRPLYFYAADSSVNATSGDGSGGVWWLVPHGVLGEVGVLYDQFTALQPNTQVETEVALVTRFSDRPRTRHAREDEFQSYDHYIKFYFEDRSSNIEIVDYVAQGGDSIEMNVRTIFPLDSIQAENRWW